MTNMKSTMGFLMSYRLSAYVTPNPKSGSISNFVVFNKIQFQLNKVCHKVSSCENFQRQCCSI